MILWPSYVQLEYPFGRPATYIEAMWRCEDKRYSVVVDPDQDLYGTSEPHIQMQWYEVVRRTPKGAWISAVGWCEHQFIRTDARKRFAWDTEAEALASLIARRERQARIYEARAAAAREVVEYARHLQVSGAVSGAASEPRS